MKLTRWIGLGAICWTSTIWAQDASKPAPDTKSDLVVVEGTTETKKQMQDAQREVRKAQESIQKAQRDAEKARRDLEQAVRKQAGRPQPAPQRFTFYRTIGGDSKNGNPFVKAYGLDFVELDPVLRSQLSLPPEEGLVIVTVTPGGQADQAAIKLKDVITKLDLVPVAQVQAAKDLITKSTKKSIYFDLIRAGKPVHLTMNKPETDSATPEVTYWIGIPVAPVDATLRSHLPDLAKGSGLIVTDVVAESPAAKGGIQKYDILIKVGDRSPNSNEALVKEIQQSDGKELKLEILRAGKALTLTVTPEKRSAGSVRSMSGQEPSTVPFLNQYTNELYRLNIPAESLTSIDKILTNPGNIDGSLIRVTPGQVEGLPLNGPKADFNGYTTQFTMPQGLTGPNLRLEQEMKELADKLETLRKMITELNKTKSPSKE